MMVKEMQDVQPLTHLLSKYVIRPISFDANPYILPKSAQFVKYGGKNAYQKKMAAQEKYKSAQTQENIRRPSGKGVDEEANDSDDFEKVEDKPKRVTRVKTIEAPQGNIFDRNAQKPLEEEKTEAGQASLQATKSDAEELPKQPEQPAPVKEETEGVKPVTPVQPEPTEQEKTQKEKQQARKQKKKEEANKPITANELQDLLKREEPKPKTPEESDKSEEEEKKEEEKKVEAPKIVRKG